MAFPTAPRAFRDPEVLAGRRALLDPAAPLVRYAAGLRADGREVPDFDPLNAGAEARLLFLLEKPGPMTSLVKPGRRAGSGLISPDNDDPTAEAVFRFLSEAGVDRAAVTFWNVIPWWNGTIAVTGAEHRAGLAEFDRLLPLLPDLRAVVLVGNRAAQAEKAVQAGGLTTFRSAHPSPQVRAANPEMWRAIPEAWGRAAEHAQALCKDGPDRRSR